MVRRDRETAKFLAFLGILALVLAAGELLHLDWFYAGFFCGVIVGGVLFSEPIRRSNRA